MRKLVLLAVMAAAMAFSAPSAFAVVEVEDSASGNMCDDTAAGYCETNWGADLAALQVHTIFGEVSYVCDVSIPVHVQSDGSLSGESVSITDEAGATGNCDDVTPCEQPWTGVFSEVSGSEFLSRTTCISGLITCEGTLHSPALTDTGSGYTAEFNGVELEGDTACEYSGHYALEGIEIHHP